MKNLNSFDEEHHQNATKYIRFWVFCAVFCFWTSDEIEIFVEFIKNYFCWEKEHIK